MARTQDSGPPEHQGRAQRWTGTCPRSHSRLSAAQSREESSTGCLTPAPGAAWRSCFPSTKSQKPTALHQVRHVSRPREQTEDRDGVSRWQSFLAVSHLSRAPDLACCDLGLPWTSTPPGSYETVPDILLPPDSSLCTVGPV